MTSRLHNKVALVTGAARGIGESIARLFAAESATVLVTDIDDEKGQAVALAIGQQAHYFHLDVTQEAQWESVMQEIVSHYGRLDILINNAGVIHLDAQLPQDPEHCDLLTWQKILSVNLDGIFLGCQQAIRVMKNNQRAAIVNMGSRSGLVGIPDAAAYAASKAAIRNHTKTVALYCAAQGYDIRCNVIHPAAILTPLWYPLLGEGEVRIKNIERMAQNIPLKKMGTPQDVAYAALYLASDESAYVTGTELIVDGGILAGSGASPQKNR